MLNRKKYLILIIFLQFFFTQIGYGDVKSKSVHLSSLGRDVYVKNETVNFNTIILNYKLPDPEFYESKNQRTDNINHKVCALDKRYLFSKPGFPILPYVPVRVILPYGREISHVTVIPKNMEEYDDIIVLAYGEPKQKISSKFIKRSVQNKSLYESNFNYPRQKYKLMSSGKRCGVNVALIYVFPIDYVPLKSKVSFYKEFKIIIETIPNRNINTSRIIINKEAFSKSGTTEENPEMLFSYSDNYIRNMGESAYDYLLITDKSILHSLSKPNVFDLIKIREEQGLRTKIITTEEIYSTVAGSDNKNKIRNFIKNSYNNNELKFVLLGGDVNLIPKMEVPCTTYIDESNYEAELIVTDIPYQCLDGDEWENDFEAEVFIGRIPAENDQEFSNQVYKILAYEGLSNNDLSLYNGFAPSEIIQYQKPFTTSEKSLQDISKLFPNNFHTYHIKEDSIPNEQAMYYYWTPDTIVKAVNENKFSIINHFGHGYRESIMKLDFSGKWSMNNIPTWQPDDFKNDKMILIKSQACHAGNFSVNCVAEQLTTSNRNGMYAAILNSHWGWYYPGDQITECSTHKVHYTFWEGRIKNGIEYLGAMNEYSHRMNSEEKWDICTSNLLGDPATKVRVGGSETSKKILNEKVKNKRYHIELLKINTKIISLSIPVSGKYSVELFTISGRKLFNNTYDLNKGINNIELKKEKLFANQAMIIKVNGKYGSVIKKMITIKK